jgi:hypothetical protein
VRVCVCTCWGACLCAPVVVCVLAPVGVFLFCFYGSIPSQELPDFQMDVGRGQIEREMKQEEGSGLMDEAVVGETIF